MLVVVDLATFTNCAYFYGRKPLLPSACSSLQRGTLLWNNASRQSRIAVEYMRTPEPLGIHSDMQTEQNQGKHTEKKVAALSGVRSTKYYVAQTLQTNAESGIILQLYYVSFGSNSVTGRGEYETQPLHRSRGLGSGE